MFGEKAALEKRIAIDVNQLRQMKPHDLKRRIIEEINRGLNEMAELSLTPLEEPAMAITIVALGTKRESLIITQ